MCVCSGVKRLGREAPRPIEDVTAEVQPLLDAAATKKTAAEAALARVTKLEKTRHVQRVQRNIVTRKNLKKKVEAAKTQLRQKSFSVRVRFAAELGAWDFEANLTASATSPSFEQIMSIASRVAWIAEFHNFGASARP